ncbi:MAG TPA: SpoIIE family protein phosphatase [Thermoanaerobaculia bacterium]|nr:SpoIIE family protein phosphatase [Thermoanaerobaculia bacterium]
MTGDREDAAVGRVLVVDDTEANRDLLSRRVARLGHEVREADDGRRALEMMRAEPFDVVLLDLMMPGMSGFEVLEQMKASEELRHLRVIIVSAMEGSEAVTRCLQLGADDFLPKPFDRNVLAARLASSLARKQLHDRERLHLRSIERELEIGRQIQSAFLPRRLPEPAGWEIAALSQPARQVGGDFYDAFALPGPDGERIAVAVGDVCGKGVGAALFMALFRSLLRVTLQGGLGAGEGGAPAAGDGQALLAAVRATNDYVARTHGDTHMFATVFLGLLDPASGRLRYVNAGHEPPLLLAPGAPPRELAPTGPAVGLMPELPFAVGEAALAPGEVLVVLTDGVGEARDAAGGLYGEQRLRQLLAEPAASAAGLLRRIESAVGEFAGAAEPADDLTLLAVRRAESSVGSA